jgi:hypothetical protein
MTMARYVFRFGVLTCLVTFLLASAPPGSGRVVRDNTGLEQSGAA